MTIELYSLALLTLLYFYAWLPASIAKRQVFGRDYLLSNRDPSNPNWQPQQIPQWGQRADRAFENLKGYFPAFIVSVLILDRLQIHDSSTEIAAAGFCFFRILHYFFYTIGYVGGRAFCWAVACILNTYLILRILLAVL